MKIRTLNPATVIASLALLFSLSGTAVATSIEPLITGADVKNSSLTGIDVKKNSIGSVDVKDGSLRPVDFKAGMLPAGPQGPAGPAGPAGPQGLTGPQGLNGVSGLQFVQNVSAVNSTSTRWVIATCPAGKKVVGGGGSAYGATGGVGIALFWNHPNTTSSWRVAAQEIDPYALNWYVVAYAICADVAA